MAKKKTNLIPLGDRVVLRSLDAGATWTRYAHDDIEGELTDQCWTAPDVGVMSGTFGIFHTDDGGVTFTPAFVEIPDVAQRNRYLLLGLMTAAGWDCYLKEWWHYQLFNARRLPLIADSVLPAPMMPAPTM